MNRNIAKGLIIRSTILGTTGGSVLGASFASFFVLTGSFSNQLVAWAVWAGLGSIFGALAGFTTGISNGFLLVLISFTYFKFQKGKIAYRFLAAICSLLLSFLISFFSVFFLIHILFQMFISFFIIPPAIIATVFSIYANQRIVNWYLDARNALLQTVATTSTAESK